MRFIYVLPLTRQNLASTLPSLSQVPKAKADYNHTLLTASNKTKARYNHMPVTD